MRAAYRSAGHAVPGAQLRRTGTTARRSGRRPGWCTAIDHDDFDARYVGHTADGRQFFVTRPFEPGEEGWRVTVERGNYMAFAAPWDSGIYDTWAGSFRRTSRRNHSSS